jgi:hypothetical protein
MPDQEHVPDPAATPTEADIDRMIDAALGGLTPHEALLKASRQDSEKVAERNAAIEKNRERALKLLAAIEKTQG